MPFGECEICTIAVWWLFVRWRIVWFDWVGKSIGYGIKARHID